ncbi:YihY/virulence factor BrkB family protein [Rhodococcus sp. Eu-32]|uniref:YihY/virulence factor BrkB family protein n=1 Tax=Rhodococcus sp. Eu-32 TaxID=1017319 RepID=UPI001FB2BE89|nr:YihY/virulence factor BrkB family protein [Rhodococcus sp. Eu-32]
MPVRIARAAALIPAFPPPMTRTSKEGMSVEVVIGSSLFTCAALPVGRIGKPRARGDDVRGYAPSRREEKVTVTMHSEWLRPVRRNMTTRLGASDLSLVAGGLTFYAAIAVVPVLLLALRAATVVTSPEWVLSRMADVAELLPDALGARSAVITLAEAGATLSLLGVLIAIFPATFYGEGLRRALVAYRPVDENLTGWRGRALVLPFVLLSPFLVVVMLRLAEWLADATTSGGVGSLALRVWIGFIGTWLVLAVAVSWVFAVVGPGLPRATVVAAGALVTASFLAGFAQGFVLFLAIPVDLGAPFGGLTVIGAVIAAGLWMFLLHVLLLVGWALTLAIDELGW